MGHVVHDGIEGVNYEEESMPSLLGHTL